MQSSPDVARRRAGSGPTACPPSPGSPTLTNPDMILPDYVPSYDDSSISFDQTQSPVMMWKPTIGGELPFGLSPAAFTAGPITPTTQIMYGNGTMLSDIGEVTEVESTCGTLRSRSGSTRSEVPIVTSTALPLEAIRQRIKQSRMAHQRQTSVGSNSTVTAQDQPGLFVDFDDTVSIDDSNFQGDDEDSVADSYIDDTSAQETIKPAGQSSFSVDDARYSTPWGRRAEQILANAKRRLTTMEDNLNRARSSLESPPLSSMGSYSTPSPPAPSAPSAPPARLPLAIRSSLGNSQDRQRFSHGHNRISSEGNIPAENIPGTSAQRSVSALGTVGGYRHSLQGHRKTDEAQRSTNGALSNSTYSNGRLHLYGQDRSLERLSEDEASEGGQTPRQFNESAQDHVLLSPFESTSDKDPKRSTSSAQMRELKDQVNDLKGRLSSLRDQARADRLKRRSLQSLRTPSPFTHAHVEQWYADASSHEDDEVPGEDSGPQTVNTSKDNQQDPPDSASVIGPIPRNHDQLQSSQFADAEKPIGSVLVNAVVSQPTSPNGSIDSRMGGAGIDTDSVNELDDSDDTGTEGGYEFTEANEFDDTASESDASSYHDTVQAQVSHEDREDAFDYEHFFLHSAMGSMTRRRMRRQGSIDSFSSEDSAETTRGPTASQSLGGAAINPGHISRRNSTGSTSTMDSFATATEGRHTRVGIITPEDYSDEYVSEYGDEYSDRIAGLPERARTHTPDTGRRRVFSPETSDSNPDPKRSQSSAHRRPSSSAAVFRHRPTISSLSTGTNRSFPLISKSNGAEGVLSPKHSPDQGLQQITETLMGKAASVHERAAMQTDEKRTPMQMLQKDDQILVERLVATLGRCILGLAETGRASAEGRAYRRKIEAARRALEGVQ